MISANVTIVRAGDPVPWPDLDRSSIVHTTEPLTFALLDGGMSSGCASVAVRVPLPDGRTLVAETSLAILTAVLAAARGAFPREFDGGPFATRGGRPVTTENTPHPVAWFDRGHRDPTNGTLYLRADPTGGTLNLQPERTATPDEPLPKIGCTTDHHGGPCTCTVLDPEPAGTDEPVHDWFGLSYANYAVTPRTLLQSMPVEWQRRWVQLMGELSDAFAHVPQAPAYQVTPCEWRSPDDVDDETLTALGFSIFVSEGARTYCTPNTEIVEGWQECVPVPVRDPIPHYDRGRARVQPRTEPA